MRDNVDSHSSLYLFSYENMRSSKFKDIRVHFSRSSSNNPNDDNDMADVNASSGSKIMLGKNKLLQIALGKSLEDEYSDNLHHVSKLISSNVGILFTSLPSSEVIDYFNNYVEPDYARAGCIASRDVYITNEMLQSQPVTMLEQQFQKQKLPIKISNGKLIVMNDKDKFKLCKKGEVLSVDKCNALKQFQIQLSEFKVELLCRWSNDEFEKL